MKNYFAAIIISTLFFACNANSNKASDKDSVKSSDQVGVPNVNGNIPDTTNAVDLTHKLDTMGKKK